ncbi:protein-tyrosine phosphatase-like protein [Thelephora terrestris]|uniref:Protein-tyrosine phosphatase-like protein n=1 Tax=Thelephora terrestris TaxID=56493 RepID=A0A9P6HNB4_9AGAM|nr:protein-tyrosine phosphatase-like protein [Thelephora terrestris]
MNPKLNEPPFVQAEGVINIRDAGGQPSHLPSHTDHIVKPRYLYRAGEPSRITPKGKTQLRDELGVRKVFDLRSDMEVKGYKADSLIIEGVGVVKAPVSSAEAYDPFTLAKRVQRFRDDPLEAFLSLYMEIIEKGSDSVHKILTHIRDHPDEPCLVHCTAGKDRTGTIVAIIHMLLGVEDEEIVKDYTLTTIGLEPALPALVERFKAHDVYRDDWEGTMNMSSSKPEWIIAFLGQFREKYGTVEGYVKNQVGLSDIDIEKIRVNLLVPKVVPN